MMKIYHIGFFLLVSIGLLTISWPTAAQQMGDYELVATVIGAGGSQAGGVYEMDVVVGQTAVSQQASGDYELGSGIWGDGIADGISELIKLYLPLLRRG